MATLQSTLVAASTPVANVRVIAFNRPEKRNALSQALIADFLRELSEASQDPEVNTIVITGNSSFFSGPYTRGCEAGAGAVRIIAAK